MKSILTIKDLAKQTELGRKEMADVRGGFDNQANGTSQLNSLAAFAPVNIANGAMFAGSAPVIIQSDSHVEQSATNTNTTTNFKGIYGGLLREMYAA